MIADIEELENLGASEIHALRLNAKEVLMPKMVNISYSRSQMEQQTLSGRDQVSKIHHNLGLPCTRRRT